MTYYCDAHNISLSNMAQNGLLRHMLTNQVSTTDGTYLIVRLLLG